MELHSLLPMQAFCYFSFFLLVTSVQVSLTPLISFLPKSTALISLDFFSFFSPVSSSTSRKCPFRRSFRGAEYLPPTKLVKKRWAELSGGKQKTHVVPQPKPVSHVLSQPVAQSKPWLSMAKSANVQSAPEVSPRNSIHYGIRAHLLLTVSLAHHCNEQQ